MDILIHFVPKVFCLRNPVASSSAILHHSFSFHLIFFHTVNRIKDQKSTGKLENKSLFKAFCFNNLISMSFLLSDII